MSSTDDQQIKEIIAMENKRIAQVSKWHNSSRPGQKNYTGLWGVRFLESGQISSITEYKDGRKDGVETFWNENGKPCHYATYKNGKLDGRVLIFNINGLLIGEENYVDGKKNGMSKFFHPISLKLIAHGEYRDDLPLNGSFAEFKPCFDDKTNKPYCIYSISYYKNGKLLRKSSEKRMR